MARFTLIAVGVFLLLWSGLAKAQPQAIKEAMDRNLLLEKEGKYREAYSEWQKFMKIPAIRGNQPADRKICFTAYFYSVRTLYKTATLDPKINDRQKLIDGAAKMIVTLEFTKMAEGWKIAGPMFEELLKEKESEQLKKAYDKLKSERGDR